mgnify:CR=1 FL=1
MSRSARRFVPLLSIAFAGCGAEAAAPPPPAGPQLPPLQLVPMVPVLEELAARLPAPAEAKQRELQQLADLALQLVSGDPRTVALAERSLLADPAAFCVLEPALLHDDVAVRRRAAWLCGQSGQTVLQLPLLMRLKYELDPETVVWVADALQRLGNDSGLGWLEAAIGNEATAQQAGSLAIAALQERGIEVPAEPTWDDLRRLLRAAHARWRETGVTTRPDVAAPDPVQLEARLAKGLLTPNGWQLRPVDDARHTMRLAGQLAVPMLARTVHAEEHYIRTMPLQVLAELGPAAMAAVPAVLPVLHDPLSRAYAIRALGEIGDGSVVPFLRPLLAHEEVEVRAVTAEALGLLADEQSRPLLEARLADANEAMDVRVNAAFALRWFGPHEAADAFLATAEQSGYHEPTLRRLTDRLARH